MNTTAEVDLLARCRQGEAKAWDELFARHYAAAGRFVFQLGYDFSREDVEEICQEVFLSVIRNLAAFQGHSRFQTWLFRIAANKARDYRQRQLAAKRGGGQESVPLHPVDWETGLAVDPPTPAPGPDLSLLHSEQLEFLGEALAQLDEASRQMLELRYFADLSYEEIGQSLQLHPKTVGSRLSRCLDKLEKTVQSLLARKSPVPMSNP